MKHLGDITKINGAEIEPVWCITGGSPCQDLSVAGKRAGLAGARSGLFMEQVRIVKEMRENDKRMGRTGDMVRPRFLVWENVPGAFSSNFKDGFGDFGAVLEEIVRIAEPTFSLPRLEGKQKWTKAGAIYGDEWSVAWRTHDAQYWGVAQRRRRISVVADFGGQCAGEILFERESLSGYSKQSKQAREEAAKDFRNGIAFNDRVAYGFDPSASRDVGNYFIEENANVLTNGSCPGHHNGVVVGVDTYNQSIDNVAQPLRAADGGDTTPKVAIGIDGYNASVEKKTFPQQAYDKFVDDTIATTLKAQGGSYGGGSESIVCEPSLYDMTHYEEVIRDCGSVSPVLKARMGTGGNNVPLTVQRVIRWIVRRLTPLECTRLQGFPDGWVEIGEWIDSKGKKHKDADSPKYKALGNSIALPFWYWMFCRMANQLPEDATLGSLFDGISGFNFCWARIHGPHTCRWSSEIEEFPIAVVKQHFGDEDTGEEGDIWKYLQM